MICRQALIILVVLFSAAACESSQFTSGGGDGAGAGAEVTAEPTPNPFGPGAENNTFPGSPISQADVNAGSLSEDLDRQIDGLITATDGSVIAGVDLQLCANSTGRGVQSYGPGNPTCPINSVVVIINDGSAKEMTCCPLQGTEILSTELSEVNQRRTGSCGPDEVATGAEDSSGPVLRCTKVNTKYFKVSQASVTATYAKSNSSSLSPELKTLVGEYNINDTCMCPENYIILGNHTTSDNKCTDRCGTIVRKTSAER